MGTRPDKLVMLLTFIMLAGAAHAQEAAPAATVVEMLGHADIPTLDPAKLEPDEIASALDGTSFCAYRYSSYAEPVLAISPATLEGQGTAVVKINGDLLILPASSTAGTVQAQQDELTLIVTPDDPTKSDQQEATLSFEIGADFRVGYRGYFDCLN